MMFKLKKAMVLLVAVGFILGFCANVPAADDNGKININTATVEELAQLKGVGEKTAEKIIQFREEHGLFKNVADLEQVKGIGPKILADNLDKLTI
jgi:competence protein ComEA